MRPTARFRKHIRWFLDGMIVLGLAAITLLWLLLHFRLRESLRLLVARESKGRFVFEAGEAGISLSQGSLHLKAVHLYTPDTTGRDLSCDIRIPEIYLSLASWKALLTDNKLMVDSLAITGPVIRLQPGAADSPSTRKPRQPADWMAAFDSTLRHLNVHAFSLSDGDFYFGSGSAARFEARHIDIQISDFARDPGAALHLAPSNRLRLSLSALRWTGPDALQRISIGRLRFDSRSQRFEADSLSFIQRWKQENEEYLFTADRCYIQTREIAAAFASHRLLLDTLICINPVLHQPLTPPRTEHLPARDQPLSVAVSVRFVGVFNGKILLHGRDGRIAGASTRQASCRIYGLSIDGNRPTPIHTDSVRFRLDKLAFSTRDGQYSLTIDQLGLDGEDAVFRDVHYGPTRENTPTAVTFTAPSLRLRRIDINQLLQGHLHAAGAVLLSPRFSMVQQEGASGPSSLALPPPDKKKIALFYHTLHDIKEIIEAGYLDISDGAIHYVRPGSRPADATATGLDAHILLNGILGSEDLLDIRYAITDWRVGKFHVAADGQQLTVSRYQLSGARRRSQEEEVEFVARNGWTLHGHNIFWSSFDWDSLQRNGIFRIDTLHIARMDVSVPEIPPAAASPSPPAAAARTTQKILPLLDIASLSVDTLSFEHIAGNGQLRFLAANIALTGIRTAGNTLAWEQVAATLRNIQWQRDDNRLTADRIDLDGKRGLRVTGVDGRFLTRQGRVEASAPLITIDAPVTSLSLRQHSTRRLHIPLAAVRFSRITARDSLELGGEFTLAADFPYTDLYPISALTISFRNTGLTLRSADKTLSVAGVTGHLHTDSLRREEGQRPDWRTFLNLVSIDKASLRYETPVLSAAATNLSWRPDEHSLRLAQISIRPAISRDTFFHRSQWQGDYIAGSASELVLQGLQVNGDAKRPAIAIACVRLDGCVVEASRDKNIPFRHGLEKPMPTKLLASLSPDITIHQLNISDSRVVYNEISTLTGRWSHIILDGLSAAIGPLTTRSHSADTLTLDATARFFDGHIRHFSYRESYGDSLSGFEARATFSPLDLTRLSDFSGSAAAISITGGHVDTAWSVWRGNRYAAYGFMGLQYRDFHIRVLDKKDSSRAGFLPALETFAANILLPKHNRRGSLIFYQRNQEKFVFNYWVKTQTSGILSTIVHKKDDAYKRLYAEYYRQYLLPPGGLSAGPW